MLWKGVFVMTKLDDSKLGLAEKKRLESRRRKIAVQVSYFVEANMLQDDGTVVPRPNAKTEDEWKQAVKDDVDDFIKKYPKLEIVAFIFHDRCLTDKGGPKTLHAHILIKSSNPMKLRVVGDFFGVSRAQDIDEVKHFSNKLLYLRHLTVKAIQEGKVEYDRAELDYRNLTKDEKNDYVEVLKELVSSENKKDDSDDEVERFFSEIIEMIRNDGLEYADAVKLVEEKFAVDLKANVDEQEKQRHTLLEHKRAFTKMKNSEIKIAREDYMQERARKRRREGRDLTTAYISGPSRAGKTSLGKAIGYEIGEDVHLPPAPSGKLTFDFVGSYNGQKTTVLNEVGSKHFGLDEFLVVFDKHTQAEVSSRNVNVDWLADYGIFTNSITVDSWAYTMLKYEPGAKEKFFKVDTGLYGRDFIIEGIRAEGKDKMVQILRRLDIEIYLTEGNGMKKAYLNKYNAEAKTFEVIGYWEYPMSVKIGPNKADTKWLAQQILERIERDEVHPKFKEVAFIDVMLDQDFGTLQGQYGKTRLVFKSDIMEGYESHELNTIAKEKRDMLVRQGKSNELLSMRTGTELLP